MAQPRHSHRRGNKNGANIAKIESKTKNLVFFLWVRGRLVRHTQLLLMTKKCNGKDAVATL